MLRRSRRRAAAAADEGETQVSLSQKADTVLRRFQRTIRERHLELAEPDLLKARAYADNLQPHSEDGRLYRAIALTEPCRPWKKGARITLAVFDRMGVSIALYMRLVYWCVPLFALVSVIALVPMGYNMTGSFVKSNQMLTMHSLGNAPELNACHGVTDVIIVLIFCAAIVRGTRKLREASETLMPRRPSRLSAANYTLMVSGLPQTEEVEVRALRELFEAWGEVITVAISRSNRSLIKLVRTRNALNDQIHERNIATVRAQRGGKLPEGSAKAAAARRQQIKLQSKLESLKLRISALRTKPQPCTGVCFVTFNEQRAAHTCLQDVIAQPLRELSRPAGFNASPVVLRAEFAPPPDNIIWENLGYGPASRFFRRLLVNCILLVQCTLSSAAITHVTNSNVEIALDEDSGFVLKTWTMFWTTGIVIASNITIFITAPIYMQCIERDHSADKREMMLAGKLLAFQLFNGFATTLSFLWTKDQARPDEDGLTDSDTMGSGTMGLFDRQWYEVGGATVVNTLIADVFIINLLVEGVRLTDVLPARLIGCKAGYPWSPLTQQALNRRYAAKNPLYLPFRMQLLLKMFALGCAFGYALPVMYPLTFVFCLISYFTDRSGLLRTFTGILNAGDKLVILLAMIDVVPWALVLHALLSVLTAHHFELDRLGLSEEIKRQDKTWLDHTLVWSRHFDTTVKNGWVALAFIVFIFTFVFASCLVFNEKRLRRARKERLSRRFARLPRVGSKAFKQLRRGVNSVKGLGRKARLTKRPPSMLKTPESHLTQSASGSTLSEIELVPQIHMLPPAADGAASASPAAEAAEATQAEGVRGGAPSTAASVSDSAEVEVDEDGAIEEAIEETSEVDETQSVGESICTDPAEETHAEEAEAEAESELEADLTPFRELHSHKGASVQLYIPPLTAVLLSSMMDAQRAAPPLRPSHRLERDTSGAAASNARPVRRFNSIDAGSRLPRELDVLAITELADTHRHESVAPGKLISQNGSRPLSQSGSRPLSQSGSRPESRAESRPPELKSAAASPPQPMQPAPAQGAPARLASSFVTVCGDTAAIAGCGGTMPSSPSLMRPPSRGE